MSAGREPVEIFPVSLDMTDDANITDFRPVAVPASAPEEEVPNPKAGSAPEPADSQEPASQKQTEPTRMEHPVLPPAVGASTNPKDSGTGS